MKKMAKFKCEEFAKTLTNIVAVGDVHGKYGELGYRIKERYKVTDSIICCCGDIGLGFHKEGYYHDEFKKLNYILKAKNNVLFFVRGNHDNPDYFNGDLAKEINHFSHLALVPDYFVADTGAGNILFIGGATSVDRSARTPNESYWFGEYNEYAPEKLDALTSNIDIVITHTSPAFTEPKTKTGLMAWVSDTRDYSLIDDCGNERQKMTNVYEHLLRNGHKPHHWAYGHFHQSKREIFDNTKFVVCDELEFFQISIPANNEDEQVSGTSDS
jgi:predicted phosphodiesterase